MDGIQHFGQMMDFGQRHDEAGSVPRLHRATVQQGLVEGDDLSQNIDMAEAMGRAWRARRNTSLPLAQARKRMAPLRLPLRSQHP